MAENVPPVKTLFRENAVKNFHTLEDVRGSIRIIKPTAWLWTLMLSFILAGILIWFVAGRLEFAVDSEGIILPESELQASESLFHTNLREHQEKIQVLKDLMNNKEKMLKKGYITINDFEQAKSDYETAKRELTNVSSESYLANVRPLFSLASSSNAEELTTLVFIDHKEGKNIISGMDAFILPSGMSAYEYGYIKAKVISISEYPVSKEMVFSYFGNVNLVDDFFKNGAPFMAKVKLTRNPKTPSGLAWTSQYGPKFGIHSGTLATVKIVYKKCSAWELVSMKGGL